MVKLLTLFKINLLTNIRYKMNFIFSTLTMVVPIVPALFLLFNNEMKSTEIFFFKSSQEYSIYLVFALSFYNINEFVWSFAFEMRYKMKEGILDEVLMLPLSLFEFIMSFVMNGVIGLLIQTIPLIMVSAFVMVHRVNVFAVLVVLIIAFITILSCYYFSVLLVALMLVYKDTDQMVNLIANIAPLFFGVLVPLINLPKNIAFLGFIFPFTWGLDIVRGIVFSYPIYLNLCVEVCILIALTILYMYFGTYVFKKLNKISKIKGGIIGY
ncbi:MAG: ABC transporter permease [Erysipelotrichaceae bacterium]|nr:ABC transporter permease [Erysipelotrichaceae bacterium]